MQHQPAQTAPRHGHQIRQTRRPLRSHRHHRRDQPMVVGRYQTRPSDSTAVSRIVTMRTVEVGRTLRNESAALIRVSEPPYMLRAVTETRPSIAKISTIPPKPWKARSPACWSEVIVSNLSPAHEASAAPRHISQMPPRAEPQYVH